MRDFPSKLKHFKVLFPELNTSHAFRYFRAVQAEGYERWVEDVFILPRPGVLGSGYLNELSITIRRIKKKCNMRILDLLSLDSKAHPIASHNRAVLEIIGAEQPEGDVVIIPAQLGFEYQGKSMDWVIAHKASSEFRIGLMDTLCMLTQTLERFESLKNLGIDCIGDVCRVAGVPDHSPTLSRLGNDMVISWRDHAEENIQYGAITGYSPHLNNKEEQNGH
jgi:hypothetical protein